MKRIAFIALLLFAVPLLAEGKVLVDNFELVIDTPKERMANWSSKKSLDEFNGELTIHECRKSSKWKSLVRVNLFESGVNSPHSIVFSCEKRKIVVSYMSSKTDVDRRIGKAFALKKTQNIKILIRGGILSLAMNEGSDHELGSITSVQRVAVASSGIDASLENVELYKNK